MKKYFITGLLILLPIAVTLFILVFLIDIFTKPFMGMVKAILPFIGQNVTFLQNHQDLLLLISRLSVLVLLFFAIVALGFLANKFLSNFLHETIHKIILKIPFVKKIYKLARDITKTFFSGKKKVFESTVVVPFPNKDSFALAFQTGVVPQEALKKVKHMQESPYKTVFVPTSPHPISGFLVMVKASDISETEITTEEAFKFIISAGTFKPEDGHDHKQN